MCPSLLMFCRGYGRKQSNLLLWVLQKRERFICCSNKLSSLSSLLLRYPTEHPLQYIRTVFTYKCLRKNEGECPTTTLPGAFALRSSTIGCQTCHFHPLPAALSIALQKSVRWWKYPADFYRLSTFGQMRENTIGIISDFVLLQNYISLSQWDTYYNFVFHCVVNNHVTRHLSLILGNYAL